MICNHNSNVLVIVLHVVFVKLNMEVDDAEYLIVNLIRNSQLDGKIHDKLGPCYYERTASPYQ